MFGEGTELIKAFRVCREVYVTPDLEMRQRAVGGEEKTAFQAKGTPYSKAWKQNI